MEKDLCQREEKPKILSIILERFLCRNIREKLAKKAKRTEKQQKKVDFVTLIEKIDNEARKQFLRLASVHL
jgi:hypothetical protein